jgi:hypothetical protein
MKTNKIIVKKCIYSSSLPPHITFYRVIDRDDKVIIIDKAQIKLAVDTLTTELDSLKSRYSPERLENDEWAKYLLSDKQNEFNNVTELYNIVCNSKADCIVLDDRCIDANKDEYGCFYYRCN